MSKILDFADGLDTGEAEADSIQPLENGEDAVQEVFNRPHEIIRERTEKLRAEAGYRRWVDDADRSQPLFALYGGTVSAGITWEGPWNGSTLGRLIINRTGLRVFPFYAPGVARADYWEGIGTLHPTRFAHYLSDNGTPGEQDIEWVSKKYDFEGGNQISITVTGVAGYGATTIVVSGSNTVPDPGVQPGQDDIVVTYDSTGGVGVDDILTAINGDSVANQLVGVTYQGSLPVTNAAYDIATTILSGGIDGVFHDITAVELANFFGASTDNRLREGDTLAIWYTTPLQRRRSIEETTESDIPAASLVNLTTEPDKAPNAVIIGRVINGDFWFANGAQILSGNTVTTLYTSANTLEVDAAGFSTLSTLSTTQEEVNADIDTELGTLGAAVTALNTSALQFTAQINAYEALANSDTFILVRSPSSAYPGAIVAGVLSGTGANVVDAWHDGALVYRLVQGDGAVTEAQITYEAEPGTGTVGIVTFNLGTVSAGMQAMAANGTYIATAEGASTAAQVRVFNMAGVPQFSFDHSAAISDMHMDHQYLYVCGADGGAGKFTVECWNLSTQLQVWSYDHGASVNAVYSDGQYVFIGGNAGTGGHHIRKLLASTGAVIAQVTDTAVPDKNCVIVSRNTLYALNVAGGNTTLARYLKEPVPGAPGVLTKLEQLSWNTTTARGLAIDTRYVYGATSRGMIAMPVDAYMQSSYQGFIDEDFDNGTFTDIVAVVATGTEPLMIRQSIGTGLRIGNGFMMGVGYIDTARLGWWQQRKVLVQ